MNTMRSQESTDKYDFLTGLPVRSRGEILIAQMMQEHDGGLVFFDMDNLKKLNDVFGHTAGDRALKLLGTMIGEVRENALACRKKGVRIVLDDFGSGYTSLSDLCDFTVDCVKIDRHIIQKSVEPTGKKLLKGICRLAHEMDIKVLCEGVETEEENVAMEDIECEYIQGFYYSRVYPKEYAMESLNLENI